MKDSKFIFHELLRGKSRFLVFTTQNFHCLKKSSCKVACVNCSAIAFSNALLLSWCLKDIFSDTLYYHIPSCPCVFPWYRIVRIIVHLRYALYDLSTHPIQHFHLQFRFMNLSQPCHIYLNKWPFVDCLYFVCRILHVVDYSVWCSIKFLCLLYS